MKRTSKSILLVAIMAILLLALTGCGGDKLVATKSSDFGDEKIEISFEDDKAKEMVWTIECEDKDEAKEAVETFEQLSENMDGIKAEQKGKKVVLTIEVEAFAALSGADVDDEAMSKDEFKKALEEDGYEVK